jgi:hypothetical protein
MENLLNNIRRILDMQRQGNKDFDQTAKLLEAYYRTLNEEGRSAFTEILKLFLQERLRPATEHQFTIHGAVIKAWARFLPTDTLGPSLFGLMSWDNQLTIEGWAKHIYPPFRMALWEYADHFSKPALDWIIATCRMYACEQSPLIRGRQFPESLVNAALGIEGVIKDIRDAEFERDLLKQTTSLATEKVMTMTLTKNWDVFISHASEDKESFVQPLVAALEAEGIQVWYDRSTLTLGDSLRRKIDEGLLNSRFGVVVLSKSFFAKEWPQKELDGLVALEDGREKVILPVWHEVTRSDVARYSPLLAARVAVPSDRGIDAVAKEILTAIRT